jgi:hypothetical protein
VSGSVVCCKPATLANVPAAAAAAAAAVALPTPLQVLLTDLPDRDWCEQQVLASANWGGHIANFFTGGLNLQVSECLG